jgi:hypothetical protein
MSYTLPRLAPEKMVREKWIHAPRLEPMDCSGPSLIGVYLRSSAARYGFPLAQHEKLKNRYGPVDERR